MFSSVLGSLFLAGVLFPLFVALLPCSPCPTHNQSSSSHQQVTIEHADYFYFRKATDIFSANRVDRDTFPTTPRDITKDFADSTTVADKKARKAKKEEEEQKRCKRKNRKQQEADEEETESEEEEEEQENGLDEVIENAVSA